MPDLGNRAKEVAAARLGVPISQLDVVNQATALLPELNERLNSFKVLHLKSGRELVIDLAENGAERDAQAVRAADRAARRQRIGALDDRLAARLASAGAEEVFDVTITLEPPPWDPPAPPEGSVTDADVRAFGARVSAARQAALAPVLQRAAVILQAEGVAFEQQAESAVLRASVSAAVLGRLATRPEIRTIEPSTRHAASLTLARKVIGADGMRGRGVEGAGVQVGVVEAKGGGFASGNPYLTGVVQGTAATGWSDWTRIPIPAGSATVKLGSSPAVSAPTTGDRIDVFMRDVNNQMRQTYWSPATGGWTDWSVLSGATFISGPGAAWWADHTKVDVFGQADSNVLKQRSSADGVWRDVDYLP